MPNLVADGELLARLTSLKNETTMIVDNKGKFVGLFTPAAHPSLQLPVSAEELSQRDVKERWEPPITEEMLRRTQSKEKGISTAELLALLESKRK